MGKDAAALYRLLKTTVAAAGKWLVPKHRPVTYSLRCSTTPSLEFVARVTHAEAGLFLSACTEEALHAACEKAFSIADTIQAEHVQFMLSATGEWRFNYALTANGTSVGSPAAFRRRKMRIEAQQKAEKTLQEILARMRAKDLAELPAPPGDALPFHRLDG